MTKSADIQVYCLTSPNGKQYIGVTNNFDRRLLKQHRYNKGPDGHALRKYGLGSFRIEILAKTKDRNEAYRIECQEIARLETVAPNGYNLTHGGDGGLGRSGWRHSPDARQRMREAWKKRRLRGTSQETRRRRAAASRGHRHSEETRQKISRIRLRWWASMVQERIGRSAA